MNFAICQTDFIKPSDFNDNPPNFPNVVLPSFSTEEIDKKDNLDLSSDLVKGYRVQIIISQNENELNGVNELTDLKDQERRSELEEKNWKRYRFGYAPTPKNTVAGITDKPLEKYYFIIRYFISNSISN